MEKKIEEKGGKKEEEVGDFFFQAEDGIRDRDVTGVQTCALPISYCSLVRSLWASMGLMAGPLYFLNRKMPYWAFIDHAPSWV